jgi:toxin ParE1/3/4
MRVQISDHAAAELEEIGNFIAEDSPVRADSFILELLDRCFGLADHSLRYPVVVTVDGLDLRRCPHGNYLIFYSVDDEKIEIAHILHSARDYLRILFPSD